MLSVVVVTPEVDDVTAVVLVGSLEAGVHAATARATAMRVASGRCMVSEHTDAPRERYHPNSSAEGVGFEPTEACASLVFKTSTFVRSVIPPKPVVWHSCPPIHTPHQFCGLHTGLSPVQNPGLQILILWAVDG